MARITEKNEDLILNVVNNVVKERGYDDIKANADGYEVPRQFTRTRTDETITPDISAVKNGRKNFFEIAVKNEKEQRTVSKWKLLSQLADFKGGKLFVIAPRGHYRFAQTLIDDYNIEAKMIRM